MRCLIDVILFTMFPIAVYRLAVNNLGCIDVILLLLFLITHTSNRRFFDLCFPLFCVKGNHIWQVLSVDFIKETIFTDKKYKSALLCEYFRSFVEQLPHGNEYSLKTHGTIIRYLELLERDGKVKITFRDTKKSKRLLWEAILILSPYVKCKYFQKVKFKRI